MTAASLRQGINQLSRDLLSPSSSSAVFLSRFATACISGREQCWCLVRMPTTLALCSHLSAIDCSRRTNCRRRLRGRHSCKARSTYIWTKRSICGPGGSDFNGADPLEGSSGTPLNWSDIRARQAKPPTMGGNITRTSTPWPARGASHCHACNRGLNTKTSAETAPHGRRFAGPLSPQLRLRSAKQTSSPVAASASPARAGGSANWSAFGSAPPCPIRPSCLIPARTIARAGRRASLESGVIVQ